MKNMRKLLLKILFLSLFFSVSAKADWTDSCQDVARLSQYTVDKCFTSHCTNTLTKLRRDLISWCNVNIRTCDRRRKNHIQRYGTGAPGIIDWRFGMNGDQGYWNAECGN